MLFKERFGRTQLLVYYEFWNIRLRPKEWESASYLDVRIYLLGPILLLTDYDLLQLNKVGDKAIFIDSSVKESCASPLCSSPGNQNQLKLVLDDLLIDEPLYEMDAPELADVLGAYLLK